MLLFTYLANKAVAIVTIQLQLFTSGSIDTTTTTRALLAIGMTFELLAILLSIRFLQYFEDSRPSQPLSTIFCLASRVPVVLVLVGIVGLAVSLVVEMLKTSLSTAVAMSGFLIFGIIFCLLALCFGAYGRR